jgi:hypothetical protein
LDDTGGGGKSAKLPPSFSILPASFAYLIAAMNSSCFVFQLFGLIFIVLTYLFSIKF